MLQPKNRINTELAKVLLVMELMGDALRCHDVLISEHLVAMGCIGLDKMTVATEAATHHTRINLLCHKSLCLSALTSEATRSNQSLQKLTIQCQAPPAMLGHNFEGERFRCSRFGEDFAVLSTFCLEATRMLLRKHVIYSSSQGISASPKAR